jgi:hypothetical protein
VLIDVENELEAKGARGKKEKRKAFTFNFKWKVVKLSDSVGVNKAASKFEVGERQLRKWRRQRTEIARAIRRGFGKHEKIRPLTKFGAVFDKAFDLYKKGREMLFAVTPLMIREYCMANDASFNTASLSSQRRALRRFKKHFGLSSRRPTGVTQILPTDAEARIEKYHHILGEEFSRRKPQKVCIGDETSVLWHAASPCTLAETGTKILKLAVKDEKKCSTAWLWGIADISYDPTQDGVKVSFAHGQPLVIFKGQPGKKVEKDAQAKAEESKLDARAVATANGWMNEDTFLAFINKTLPRVDYGWFVMDLFSAHRTPKVLDALKAKGWTVFFVPGGCTSIAQVHDKVANKPFKARVRKLYADYCLENKSNDVQRIDVLKFVVEGMTAVPVNVVSASIDKLIIGPALADANKRAAAAKAPAAQPDAKDDTDNSDDDDVDKEAGLFDDMEAALDELVAKGDKEDSKDVDCSESDDNEVNSDESDDE